MLKKLEDERRQRMLITNFQFHTGSISRFARRRLPRPTLELLFGKEDAGRWSDFRHEPLSHRVLDAAKMASLLLNKAISAGARDSTAACRTGMLTQLYPATDLARRVAALLLSHRWSKFRYQSIQATSEKNSRSKLNWSCLQVRWLLQL